MAESAAFRWEDIHGWAPDVAVGWLFVGCGLAAKALVRESRGTTPMIATGLLWFVGNFDGSHPAILD